MKSIYAPVILFVVCSINLDSSPILSAQSPAVKAPSAQDHDHERGPNGGEILEVGKHEYHLELCLDEKTNLVTVYLHDKALKKYVAIYQPHLLCNFKEINKPVQVKLLPKPRKEDAKGASSCFEVSDKRIIDALHDQKSEMRLVVKFGNKQYNVRVVHQHSH